MRRLAFSVVFAAAALGQMSNEAERVISPAGLLETNTLFTVYGRGFATAPILGRLGAYKDADAMAEDTRHWVKGIAALNGGKGVVIGIHLIYALAVPCTSRNECLQYLAADTVRKYIEIAAARGWVVVLDTQLGRSTPVAQVQRMLEGGYLKYDNVHVAIDPEFHARAGEEVPGIPIGTVTAAQINAVQQILSRYVALESLATKKILIVHQFGDPTVHDGVPFMIQNKKALRDYPNVQLVIDADGLGSPAVKVRKYNLMTSSRTYPCLRFRGIKIFFPNRWEERGHFDKPPMSLEEIFGRRAVSGRLRVLVGPDVITIA